MAQDKKAIIEMIKKIKSGNWKLGAGNRKASGRNFGLHVLSLQKP